MNKKTIYKFNIGDPLTDKECKDLFDFFSQMEENCLMLGASYDLFRYEMTRNKWRVHSYIEARKH